MIQVNEATPLIVQAKSLDLDFSYAVWNKKKQRWTTPKLTKEQRLHYESIVRELQKDKSLNRLFKEGATLEITGKGIFIKDEKGKGKYVDLSKTLSADVRKRFQKVTKEALQALGALSESGKEPLQTREKSARVLSSLAGKEKAIIEVKVRLPKEIFASLYAGEEAFNNEVQLALNPRKLKSLENMGLPSEGIKASLELIQKFSGKLLKGLKRAHESIETGNVKDALQAYTKAMESFGKYGDAIRDWIPYQLLILDYFSQKKEESPIRFDLPPQISMHVDAAEEIGLKLLRQLATEGRLSSTDVKEFQKNEEIFQKVQQVRLNLNHFYEFHIKSKDAFDALVKRQSAATEKITKIVSLLEDPEYQSQLLGNGYRQEEIDSHLKQLKIIKVQEENLLKATEDAAMKVANGLVQEGVKDYMSKLLDVTKECKKPLSKLNTVMAQGIGAPELQMDTSLFKNHAVLLGEIQVITENHPVHNAEGVLLNDATKLRELITHLKGIEDTQKAQTPQLEKWQKVVEEIYEMESGFLSQQEEFLQAVMTKKSAFYSLLRKEGLSDIQISYLFSHAKDVSTARSFLNGLEKVRVLTRLGRQKEATEALIELYETRFEDYVSGLSDSGLTYSDIQKFNELSPKINQLLFPALTRRSPNYDIDSRFANLFRQPMRHPMQLETFYASLAEPIIKVLIKVDSKWGAVSKDEIKKIIGYFPGSEIKSPAQPAQAITSDQIANLIKYNPIENLPNEQKEEDQVKKLLKNDLETGVLPRHELEMLIKYDPKLTTSLAARIPMINEIKELIESDSELYALRHSLLIEEMRNFIESHPDFEALLVLRSNVKNLFQYNTADPSHKPIVLEASQKFNKLKEEADKLLLEGRDQDRFISFHRSIAKDPALLKALKKSGWSQKTFKQFDKFEAEYAKKIKPLHQGFIALQKETDPQIRLALVVQITHLARKTLPELNKLQLRFKKMGGFNKLHVLSEIAGQFGKGNLEKARQLEEVIAKRFQWINQFNDDLGVRMNWHFGEVKSLLVDSALGRDSSFKEALLQEGITKSDLIQLDVRYSSFLRAFAPIYLIEKRLSKDEDNILLQKAFCKIFAKSTRKQDRKSFNALEEWLNGTEKQLGKGKKLKAALESYIVKNKGSSMHMSQVEEMLELLKNIEERNELFKRAEEKQLKLQRSFPGSDSFFRISKYGLHALDVANWETILKNHDLKLVDIQNLKELYKRYFTLYSKIIPLQRVLMTDPTRTDLVRAFIDELMNRRPKRVQLELDFNQWGGEQKLGNVVAALKEFEAAIDKLQGPEKAIALEILQASNVEQINVYRNFINDEYRKVEVI